MEEEKGDNTWCCQKLGKRRAVEIRTAPSSRDYYIFSQLRGDVLNVCQAEPNVYLSLFVGRHRKHSNYTSPSGIWESLLWGLKGPESPNLGECCVWTQTYNICLRLWTQHPSDEECNTRRKPKMQNKGWASSGGKHLSSMHRGPHFHSQHHKKEKKRKQQNKLHTDNTCQDAFSEHLETSMSYSSHLTSYLELSTEFQCTLGRTSLCGVGKLSHSFLS